MNNFLTKTDSKVKPYFIRFVLTCVAALIFPVFSVFSADSSASLFTQWKLVRAEQFIKPADDDIEKSQILFLDLLNANLDQPVIMSLRDISLEPVNMRVGTKRLLIVREINQHYSGAGFYIIRENGNGTLLQAPHAFKDLYTGKLAIKLMLEGNYSALALNTVPRRYQYQGIKYSADMAHMENTYFLSFSNAFAKKYPDGRVIQLHGFNSNKRKVTKNISMIISTGTKRYKQVHKIVSCLRKKVTDDARAYPDQIRTLGGTTNMVGKRLRAIGFTGFKHIEMSLPIRKKLYKNRILRESLSKCINND